MIKSATVMRADAAIGAVCAAGALAAWSVRGRSSAVFGPSVYRGDRARRSIALTFDDGPSADSEIILDLLARHGAHATFFQCGANVERHPGLARRIAAEGHEVGNHTQTHPLLCFAPPDRIEREFAEAQSAIADAAGVQPSLLRAPFGVRWFGFAAAQRRLGLLGVMWTILARDWTLPAHAIAGRVLTRLGNGAIVCLHDGRGVAAAPDISETIGALSLILPAARARGYQFETVTQILCPTN